MVLLYRTALSGWLGFKCWLIILCLYSAHWSSCYLTFKLIFFSILLFFLFVTCPGFELSHCDDPGVPQFGFKVSDQGHFAGSAITFGCDQGYTLHGSGILKCMTGERRAWDNHLPSCIGNCSAYIYVHAFSLFSAAFFSLSISASRCRIHLSHFLLSFLALKLLFRPGILSALLS